MDSKKFRRQQVINKLGKQLNFDNLFGLFCLIAFCAWVYFLGTIIVNILKSFFI